VRREVWDWVVYDKDLTEVSVAAVWVRGVGNGKVVKGMDMYKKRRKNVVVNFIS
jgi:hypothetical protein